MLVQIGQPAIPSLFFELTREPNNARLRDHRRMIASCIVDIYSIGGEGKAMAAQRIRIYADTWHPEMRTRILSVLELGVFLNPPDPVSPRGKQ
jgi:hypothetical protein